MKTKYFTLFAIVAAAVTCFTDAYMLLYQVGVTSQAQVTSHAKLLLAMLAVGNLFFAAFFFGSSVGEKGWAKLKIISLAGGAITFISCAYYTLYAIIFGSSNTALTQTVDTYMSMVIPASIFIILIFLVALFMTSFKNKLLEYSILTTLFISFIFKVVVNNLTVQVAQTGPTFAYVMVKTSFIPDVILTLMFVIMFITMIMPEKVEEPIEVLDANDVIVDDYEVEGDALEIEDNSIENDTEANTATETPDETDK